PHPLCRCFSRALHGSRSITVLTVTVAGPGGIFSAVYLPSSISTRTVWPTSGMKVIMPTGTSCPSYFMVPVILPDVALSHPPARKTMLPIAGLILAIDLGNCKSVACACERSTGQAHFDPLTTSRDELLHLPPQR